MHAITVQSVFINLSEGSRFARLGPLGLFPLSFVIGGGVTKENLTRKENLKADYTRIPRTTSEVEVPF